MIEEMLAEPARRDPNRRTRRLVVALFGLAVLVAGAVTFLTYLGVMPGISSAVGTATPRDLGVRPTPDDLDRALAKLESVRASEDSRFEVTFDDAELTALAQQGANEVGVHVAGLQVRMGDADRFEASSRFTVGGVTVPIYVIGSLSVDGGGTLAATVEEGKVASIPMTEGMRAEVASVVARALEARLGADAGFRVERLETALDQLLVEGQK